MSVQTWQLTKPPARGWSTRMSSRAVLTRFVDPANNSNKYRRFIALWDVEDPTRKMLITHTGRWTSHTEQGDWSGGTYRFAGFATTIADRKRTPDNYLDRHVQRKLGSYYVVGDTPIQPDFVLKKIDLDSEKVAPTRAEASDRMQQLRDKVAVLAPPQADADAAAWATWLWKSANLGGRNQHDLLSEYARTKDRIEVERSNLAAAETQLREALDRILQMEA